MKNIGCINPLVFWISLGAGMYIMLQIIGAIFSAMGVI